jgi:hypothetical protein
MTSATATLYRIPAALVLGSTLDQRYQAGIDALNAALKQYHPDSNGDTENNRRMTRKLIAYKAKWTETYRRMK